MDKATKIFIDCCNKDWRNISKQEDIILAKRERELNKKFVFSAEVIEKIKKLNTLLHNKQKLIRENSKHILILQEELLAKGLIDDYNIDTELQLYNDDYYIKWNEETFDGNPFYTDYTLHLFEHLDKDEIFFADNWNEFISIKNHPLRNEHFCYLFKHISNSHYLAWEDILRIDDIWIDIKIDYQYSLKISYE